MWVRMHSFGDHEWSQAETQRKCIPYTFASFFPREILIFHDNVEWRYCNGERLLHHSLQPPTVAVGYFGVFPFFTCAYLCVQLSNTYLHLSTYLVSTYFTYIYHMYRSASTYSGTSWRKMNMNKYKYNRYEETNRRHSMENTVVLISSQFASHFIFLIKFTKP